MPKKTPLPVAPTSEDDLSRAARAEDRRETRVLRPRRAAPADAVRPTRAEVNLAALRHNLHALRVHAGDAKVWAVLKADGYGHGAPAVARTLERAGADGFCVALLEEGIELREAGVRAPILVMGGYYGTGTAELLARKLVPVVYDLGQVEAFARLVRSGLVPGPVAVHLKVDTGMARLGVRMAELGRFAAQLAAMGEVRVVGLMTHLACADALTQEQTQQQMVLFDEATARLAGAGIRVEVRHAANTAALLRECARLDAVRPGLAIFGFAPRLVRGDDAEGRAPLSAVLHPVMRVRSEIVALRSVEPGTGVGYGHLWRTRRPSVIATFAMGYADGLPRGLSNKGEVLVRGTRAPIVGAVSMDMCMIDVTDIPGAGLHDEVVVFGAQDGPLGKDCITADEVADHAGMIPWEVLTNISRRVPRFYREP